MNNDEYRAANGTTHSIICESRQKAAITGVLEVISFDDAQIIMETQCGMLTVNGEQMHVEKLSLDVGEVSIAGDIEAFVYSSTNRQKGSFWSKIF